jgi:Family of unknown function (DUF6221)
MTESQAFLLEQIDRDEAVASAACEELTSEWRPYYASDGEYREIKDDQGTAVVPVDEEAPSSEVAEHICRWDPSRVIAECHAKRQLVTQLVALSDGWEPAQRLLNLIAQPYRSE